MKPLLYLELRQFVNALKNTLRSPKRLIPALIIGAGVFSWLMQFALLISGVSRPMHHGFVSAIDASQIHGELIHAGAFLLLSFGSLVVIYQAFSNGSLIFSIAQIDFLFPTPISRRSVLLVKLIKDYLKYAAWVAFFITFTGVPFMMALNVSFFPYGLFSMAALTAYLLFIINLAHTVNILFTFGFERLKQAGKAIKLALGLAFASAIVVGLRQYITTGDSCFSVLWAANSPVIKTIFAPADWCAGLLLAPLEGVTHVDMMRLGLLWLFAAASFLILMSRKENIYEPSLGVSVRATTLRQARTSGDAMAWRIQMMKDKGAKSAGLLMIPPFGKGAVALLWKNLLTKYRMSWSQLMLMTALPALIMFIVQRSIGEVEVLHFLPFILVYMAFIMSIAVQPQIRAELKHANILKSMPISSWKIMLVQAVNGSIYLIMGILVFAVSMWLIVPDARGDLLNVCTIIALFIGFACVSMTIIPALMYPNMRDSAQTFFSNLIGFILISIAITPTLILCVVMLGLMKVSIYMALVPVCVVNIIIGALGIAVSGAIFRKFDPTCE